MFLSKLILDPRHPQARRDLADAYEMHRTLARAFAPDANTPPARFLWRLERRADYQPATVVLVQSEQPANWSALHALPGYADAIAANKDVNLETLIQPSARYRFRLLANPTVTREGKRYGLTREEEQMAWIARQGGRHGFSVLGCVRGADERLQVRQGRSGNRITLHTALFEGLLQADAPESLRQGLLNGFGHGKAMGLGLMSLARVAG
jgi:CRISPR system Cascade subunit CasE